MDKSNFKKLALMGMAGGMLLASQSPLSGTIINEANVMLGGSCGSKGCGGGNRSDKNKKTGADLGSNGCGGSSNANKSRYTADAQTDIQKQQQAKYGSDKAMSESELMSKLSDEGKALYRGLDADGKAYAQKIANQYQDKNKAVKVAAQEQAMKRGNSMNRSSNQMQMQQGSSQGYNSQGY